MEEARNREDRFHHDVNRHGEAFSFLYDSHQTFCAYFGIKTLFWKFNQRRCITASSPRQIFVTLPPQFGSTMFGALFPTLRLLSHKPNVATISLIDLYFHGKCVEALHSQLDSLPYTRLACFHSIRIPLVWSRFHSAIFSWSPVTLLNRLPRQYFPNSYDRNIFKSQINRYLLYISP